MPCQVLYFSGLKEVLPDYGRPSPHVWTPYHFVLSTFSSELHQLQQGPDAEAN